MKTGPLDGIRVLDLTSVVVGPICTRTLADQGADVIKLEPPEGDILRNLAQGARNPGMSGKFINFNRNKRAICVDLKSDGGKEIVETLLATADVLVHNVRPAALARLGLDWAKLGPRFPRLVHCSIVAFGSGGRYANRPAYDPIIQSLSGVAATFERATGEPRFVPMVMADHIAGLIAAQCIGFALYRRERTGCGEAVEVPMFENAASFVMSEHLGPGTFIPPIDAMGDERLLTPEYRPLPTLDGYITITANTNAQAFAFFDAIGRPELKTDPRFASARARTENTRAYFAIRTEALAMRTTDEWVEIFERLDVPVARYNRLEDLPDDPHLRDVGFFQVEQHPSEGALRRTALANHFSGGVRCEALPAPTLGQHTREVLVELGYAEAEIERLVAVGAVTASTPPGRPA